MRRAIISVSDKTGIFEFSKEIAALGFEILSTGGTAKTLTEAGIAVTNVSDVTVDPSVFGRLFDYADVRIQTYAGEQDFDLRGIACAYEMRRTISMGMDAARQAPSTPRQRQSQR